MQSSSSTHKNLGLNRKRQRQQQQSNQYETRDAIQTVTLNATEHYTSNHLSSSLLSLLSSHGFNKTSSRAHSLLSELFVRYLHLVATDALSNANHSNRARANEKDVEAAFSNIGTETQDLIRWCRNTRESDAPLDQTKKESLRERAAELRPLLSHGRPSISPIPFHYQDVPRGQYAELEILRQREAERISNLFSNHSSLSQHDEEEDSREPLTSDEIEVDDAEQKAEEEEDSITTIKPQDKGKQREILPDDPSPPYTSSHLLTSNSRVRTRRSSSHSSSNSSSSSGSGRILPSYKRRKIDRLDVADLREMDNHENDRNIDYVPSFLPAFPDLPRRDLYDPDHERHQTRADVDASSSPNHAPEEAESDYPTGGLSADLEYLNFLKEEEKAKLRAAERVREEEREERDRKEEEIRIMHAGGDAAAVENDPSRPEASSARNSNRLFSPPPAMGKGPEGLSTSALEKDELAVWRSSTSYSSSMLGEVQSEMEIPSLPDQLKLEETEREKELEKERKRQLNAQSKRGSITPAGSGLSPSQKGESERRHSSSLFAFAADYPAMLSETLTAATSLLTPLGGSSQQDNAFSQRRRLAVTLSDSSRYSPSDTLYASIPVRPASAPFNPGPSLMITLPPQPEQPEYILNAAGEMVPAASAPPEFTPTLPNGRIVSLFSSAGSIRPTLGYRHPNQTLNSARAVSSHNLLKLISRSQDPEPLHDESHAERVFQGRGARVEWLDPIGQRLTNAQTSSLGEDGSANPSGFGIGGTDEDTNKCSPANSFLAPALHSLHLKRVEEVRKKIRNGTLSIDEEALGLQLNQIPAPERPISATLVHTWDWNQKDFTDPNLPTVAHFRKVRKEESKGRAVGFVGKGKDREVDRNTPGSGIWSGSGLLSSDNNKRGGSVGTSGTQTPASRSSPVNVSSPLPNHEPIPRNNSSVASPRESPRATTLALPQEQELSVAISASPLPLPPISPSPVPAQESSASTPAPSKVPQPALSLVPESAGTVQEGATEGAGRGDHPGDELHQS